MTYTLEQVAELERECVAVLGELEDLWVSLARDFAPSLTVESAREYVGYGVCRRLKIIRQCIENIFTVFPVGRTKLLSDEERSDVEISLHAFFIHIHGLPDNLAWIYVLENGIVLKSSRVGLFSKDTQKHLPKEICDYLSSERIKEWHGRYAKNYRDALAHRIPLYVPPSIYTPTHEKRYRELHAMISEEMKNRNFERALLLTEEQDAIGSICPAFLHSFSGNHASSPVLIHPQVIVDAKTVMEIVSVIRPHLSRTPNQRLEGRRWASRVSEVFHRLQRLIKKVIQRGRREFGD